MDNETIDGCAILVLGALFAVFASLAVGYIFGVGYGLATMAAMTFLALVLQLVSVARGGGKK